MVAYSQAGYIVSFNYNDKILNSSSSYEFIMFSGSLLIFCCRFLKNFSKGGGGIEQKRKRTHRHGQMCGDAGWRGI